MGIRVVQLIFILSLALLSAPQYIFPLEQDITPIESWIVHDGNSTQWKIDEIDTTLWSHIGRTEVWRENSDQSQPIRWFRQELVFPEFLPQQEILSIYIPALLTSYEIFWDEERVGQSGIVSVDRELSKPGVSGQLFHLTPEQSSAGRHTIAIQIYNNRVTSGSLPSPIFIGESSRLTHSLFKRQGVSLFLGGIFAITALFYFFIVGSRKQKRSHIFFSLFSLSCGGHILVSMMIEFGEIPLNLYYSFAIAGDLFWFGMLSALPLYLLSHFNSFGKKITGSIVVILAILVVLLPRLALYNIIPIRLLPALHELNLIYAYLSVFASIGVVIGSVIRKRKGSKTILIGMIIFFIGLTITTLFGVQNGWAIGFAFLNIFITIAISRQLADERKLYFQTELKSSRLELELLKKHIQPHFLLNSLNSIIAWIEEEPVVAGKLVNALSQELRMLMAYAGEKTIDISQEIKMCSTHLAVMSMRQEKEYSLLINGIKEGVKIPPFILHTLIENGISHGFRKKEEGVFTISVDQVNEKITIRLHNNGDSTSRPVSSKRGTGLRYVRSRLREIHGTDYAFSTGAVDDGWESIISYRIEKS